MNKTNFLFFVLLCFLFVLQGCIVTDFFGIKEKPSNQIYNTAEQIVEQGSFAFEDKNYREALKAFTQLKDWYPFSKYAILAELRIADCHFELKEYDEAIFAYENFEELHPKNEAIPRVIYRRGMCWYKRLNTVGRDTLPASKAIIQFNRLKKRFSESTYVSQIDQMLVKCYNNLAGHELYVAEYYYKSGNYQASLNRYKYLVEFFPTSDYVPTALSRIGPIQKKIDNIAAKALKL